MIALFLSACETLARGAQDLLPASWRGLQVLTVDQVPTVRGGRGVCLLVPPTSLLEHRLDLPDAVQEASAAWLAARVEALSPWDKDACLWDARSRGRVVHLAILPRMALAGAEAVLTAKGVRLAEVVAGPYRFRRDISQVRRWRDRLALSALLMTVLGLGLAGIGLDAGLQAQDRMMLAQTALERSALRLKEGAGPAQAALALLPRKQASVALALTHLAAALPQDSFLTTLSVTAEGFEISGQSLAPEGIIPALSADPTLTGVDFAGPAAHDADSGTYTFTIRGKMVSP